MSRRSSLAGLQKRALCLVALSLVPGAGAAAVGPESANGAVTARAAGSALGDIEKMLNELGREQRTLRARFDELGRFAENAGARAVVRGRAYVRRARAGILPLGDGFDAFVEHAATMERLRRSIKTDLAEQRAFVLERARLAERLEDLERRLGPLRAERQALAGAESALLAVEDRKRAFDRAFVASAPGGHTAIYGASGPAEASTLERGFAAARGKLPFPIAGRSEVKSSRRSSSEGTGLEMRAPVGTAVRSVYPGRVAFADTYADYGLTVILDHGDRYYTVSANLSVIDVRVGEEIAANTRIGSVGDSQAGALVYFEVRHGTQTLDPAEWFGL